MKKIIAAFAILACLASAPSYATVFNAGTLTDRPWNNSNASIDHPSGAFTDYFNFTQSSAFAGMAGSLATINWAPFVGTAITSVGLWSGTNVAPGSLVASFSTLAFSTALAPGSYFFKISGAASGTGFGGVIPSGAYTISLNATAPAAPVPEPETWLMLGIGAALVGFQLRRKANAMESLSIAV